MMASEGINAIADWVKVSLGSLGTGFQLTSGVEELEFSYIWVPMPKIKKEQEETEESEEEDFEFVELVEEDENKEGWGLPQGVRIKLTLHDPTAEEQEVTFTTTVAFRGPTTRRTGKELDGPRGLSL